MGSFSSKNEGYVNIGTCQIQEEHIVIVQNIRKILLLKEFKDYISNTNQYSVYHKHFVNSKEIESLDGITKEYCVRSTIFFTLWSINITNYENDRDKVVEWIH